MRAKPALEIKKAHVSTRLNAGQNPTGSSERTKQKTSLSYLARLQIRHLFLQGVQNQPFRNHTKNRGKCELLFCKPFGLHFSA
jgi:hypothetical protein